MKRSDRAILVIMAILYLSLIAALIYFAVRLKYLVKVLKEAREDNNGDQQEDWLRKAEPPTSVTVARSLSNSPPSCRYI